MAGVQIGHKKTNGAVAAAVAAAVVKPAAAAAAPAAAKKEKVRLGFAALLNKRIDRVEALNKGIARQLLRANKPTLDTNAIIASIAAIRSAITDVGADFKPVKSAAAAVQPMDVGTVVELANEAVQARIAFASSTEVAAGTFTVVASEQYRVALKSTVDPAFRTACARREVQLPGQPRAKREPKTDAERAASKAKRAAKAAAKAAAVASADDL